MEIAYNTIQYSTVLTDSRLQYDVRYLFVCVCLLLKNIGVLYIIYLFVCALQLIPSTVNRGNNQLYYYCINLLK